MKVAVTGAAGFLGHHLTRALIAKGHQVVAIDNLYNGDWARLKDCGSMFRRITGDIRDLDTLCNAFLGVEIVFHLAALSNVMRAASDEDYVRTTNILGTRFVCEAARLMGVKRLLFTSSREVYGEAECLPVPETALLAPINLYGHSKVAGEQEVRAFSHHFESLIVRFTNVYGTHDRNRVIPIFIERALKGEPLIIYGGQQIVDFIWVGTVVDALLKSIGLPNWLDYGALNVGSGVGVSISELAERICALSESSSPIIIRPSREIEVKHFVADVQLAHRILNLPATPDPLVHLKTLIEAQREIQAQLISTTGL